MNHTYDQTTLNAMNRGMDEEAQLLGNMELELERVIVKCKKLEGRPT